MFQKLSVFSAAMNLAVERVNRENYLGSNVKLRYEFVIKVPKFIHYIRIDLFINFSSKILAKILLI